MNDESAAPAEPGDAAPANGWATFRRKQGVVRMIAPEEFASWVTYEDEHLLVLAKPGDVVCHPSKAGPWSSLIGAARAYAGRETMHLVFRLDRETSGVVVLAKDPPMASRLQKAMQQRRIGKEYVAVLTGELKESVIVDQPLGDDENGPVTIKTCVRPDGRQATTRFDPVAIAGGFTLARVVTGSGRKHQIRAHAQWLGHSLVGDKIYGPDQRLYLEFIETGWTSKLESVLLLSRQALHCAEIDLRMTGMSHVFTAVMPDDMRGFCAVHGLDTRGL